MSYNEVEVKLLVADLQPVAARLDELGAVLTKDRLYEYNVRYENADHSLTENGIVLRLRRDDGVRLTYKAPQEPEAAARGIHSRFEAETAVADFDAMDMILKQLGFQPHMIYEKYRTTYELDDAEIVLDEMPYGNFVEIEGDEAAIEALITKLNMGDVPRIPYSYGRLFDHVRMNLRLDMKDLTFKNFAGVQVPVSAFAKPE